MTANNSFAAFIGKCAMLCAFVVSKSWQCLMVYLPTNPKSYRVGQDRPHDKTTSASAIPSSSYHYPLLPFIILTILRSL